MMTIRLREYGTKHEAEAACRDPKLVRFAERGGKSLRIKREVRPRWKGGPEVVRWFVVMDS